MIDRSAPILLIEPDATAFTVISDLLCSLGFDNVEAAADSTTALELLGSYRPMLIISDLHVAPLNGLQLLRTIREDERLSRTSFLLAAQALSPLEALAIKNAGVDSLLLKPFSADVLSTKIEAAVKARPRARVTPEVTVKRPLSAALGRRFQRYHN
jgi:two-component system chemotaxis response regulator CheY